MGSLADKLAAKSPKRREAILGNIHTLVKSNKSAHLKRYYELLTDFDFLTQKIHHPGFGVQALIEDYELISDSEATTHPEYNPAKVKILKQIQGALRLSAHVLAKDKTQLVEQLLGRMQGFDVPEIQQLLFQAKQSKTTWLRPLTPSLTPPGGRLLCTLSGHSDSVRAVAVTADGKRAISGSWDKTLKLWNLETGEELFTLKGHSHLVSAVAVTADGKRAISGSWDKTLKLWNLETGEELFTLNGHSSFVNAVAVTADGKRAISGSNDSTLKLWNLETGEELFTLNGHSGLVSAVAVTADSKRAISGSNDFTLKLWNLETGEVIASFTGDGSILCCAVAPDGVTLVAGEQSGRVHFLRLEGMEASP
jgi:WD40 repeat protein